MERKIIELQPEDYGLLVQIISTRRQRPIAYRVQNGCWLCLSHLANIAGYPGMTLSGKKMSVAQYMFIRHTGIIPKKGEVIRHTCDHSECINPAHLILGTQRENYLDYQERGKSPYNTRRKPRKNLRKGKAAQDFWNALFK